MKNYTKLILFVAIGFSLLSCKPKIDATNMNSLHESVEKVKNSLEGNQKEEFEKYLGLIMDEYTDFSFFASKLAGFELPPELKRELDNKTANEIIEQGKIIEEEEAKRQIDELYSSKLEYDKSKQEIDKFNVSDASYKHVSYYYIDDEVISFTIKNNTNHPVSRIYFDIDLISKNRSTPWNSTHRNYLIPGGIEVGESKTLDLSIGMFDSNWKSGVNPPKDAILKITITKLDDSQGEKLFSIEDFTKDDSHLLDSLLSKFPKFKK